MSWKVVVFSFVFLHVLTNVSLHPRCIFRTESFCLYKHSVFKLSRSHQIKTLMARHPFKNPLKALVTFQATCFCGFFIHLIQKNQQNINRCKSIKSVFKSPPRRLETSILWFSPFFLSGAAVYECLLDISEHYRLHTTYTMQKNTSPSPCPLSFSIQAKNIIEEDMAAVHFLCSSGRRNRVKHPYFTLPVSLLYRQ